MILVGGKGTRLRPLTDDCPKPILPVLDKPCLEYFIDSIAEAGITDVILACGYKSEKMAVALGDGSKQGISITYAYEDHPMGTGGAVKLLEDRLDDIFVVVNGDVFIDLDLEKEIEEHYSKKADVTIALTTVENPCEYGIARQDDDGRIMEFKEKPKPEEVFSNLINAGVYIVNKEVLRYIPEGVMYDFSKELFPLIMSKGYRIQGHSLNGHWRDVGRPSDLIDANLEMADRLYRGHDWSDQVTSSNIIGEFYAGEGTAIKGSKLDRSIIHKNCEIIDSDIKNSLVLPDCNINSAILIGTVLGKHCSIGAGSKVVDSVLADGTIVGKNQVVRNARGA